LNGVLETARLVGNSGVFGGLEDSIMTKEPSIAHEEIAQRAYEIWQSRGCPPGDGSEDWQAAKAELSATRARRNGSTQARMQSWWSRVRQKLVRQAS
jgi:hypothetical protein